jgi:aminopeptidase
VTEPDPRWDELARLLVDRSLDVQPGWQVAVRSSPLSRPLFEAVCRRIAQRGAYALPRLVFGFERWPIELAWAEEAPPELLETLAPINLHEGLTLDARLTILAPEQVRDGPPLPHDRRVLVQRSLEPLSRRMRAMDVRWAVTQYPTEAAAQTVGMTVPELTEFVFGACLRDWDAEERRLRRFADRLDAAEEIRIVGTDTNLRLSVSGRRAEVDHGLRNMPGGEVFLCPLEDSAEGVITYGEVTNRFLGSPVEGARLVFREGAVVEATARSGEDVLLQALDTDEGARRLGEVGIGCNPGITRAMGNLLFDEKIDGTVHLALGGSYTFLGGTNDSAIHWDMVKDLRRGGELWADGELVQRDGTWLI